MVSRANDTRRLVVWRFADGVRGHENQSDGLIAALAGRAQVSVHTVSTPRNRGIEVLWRTLLGADYRTLPNPDLLVGTGQATHLPMLAARRRRGGRVVVLMKPSFPMAWFDLLIVPAHDHLQSRPNLLTTRGSLNRMRPAIEKNHHEGLILIGGPDREHPWAPEELEAQIAALVEGQGDVHWSVASSRRTPADFLVRLGQLGLTNLETVAVEEVDAEWLPAKLATTATVWVTEDSVSMLYEALTAGAATGLLSMPRRSASTSKRNLGGGLLADGLVTSFDAWRKGQALRPPSEPLDEAGRCADWVIQKWQAPPSDPGDISLMTDPALEMRILQVLPALNEGGVEVGTVQMARYLQARGIFNVVASSGGKLVASLEQIDVAHITLPLETKNPLKILLNAGRLKSAIKKYRITHVHARSRAPAWSAYLACSLINASAKEGYVFFLTTFHGVYGKTPAIKRWYNSIMLKGDAVIANSAFVKNHIAKVYGDTGKPIYVVHRGNDLERFNPGAIEQSAVDAVRESMGASAGTPLILMVGRLTAWKGQAVLLSALAELKDIPWVAAFAGSAENPAYKQNLEGMIKDADMEDRIHLLGSRDDVPLLYRAADIAVSASTEPEAFGRVAIEAQAMETGIIATAHGGSLETVIDGETGFLVEPSYPTSLKAALIKALTDLGTFAAMGKAGRAHVCRNLTEEEMCRGETAVYVALRESTAEKLRKQRVA